MNKTLLIISREYYTRVKKKSFIILTLLLPILMAALIVVPVIIATRTQTESNIMVVDETEFFINRFTDTEKTKFSYESGNIENIKKEALKEKKYDAVLHILKGSNAVRSNLYYHDEPSMTLRSNLESQMDKVFFDKVLQDSFQIDPEKFQTIKDLTRSSIATIQIDDEGNEKESMAEMNKMIGLICGFVIYFFIFMFSGQVLRGVLEEKTNRIVEVLISSVKPVQLLMGKIIGIALVGLTQFVMWIVFTFVIILGVQVAVPDMFTKSSEIITATAGDGEMMQNEAIADSVKGTSTIFDEIAGYFPISFTQLILCFLFYFLLGYLVYSSLFAAVGSAADNETDSQQFQLPLTIPLLLTIVLVMPMADAPNGQLAFWFSMIPLTSPVAMLTRLPSGVPLWELLLSMSILVLFFLFTVWLSAKIYRTGILMYGKKISYKELWKWIKY